MTPKKDEAIRELVKEKLGECTISTRGKAITEWFIKHRKLINETDCVKIIINIKGTHVVGEIRQYPDSKT